MSVESDGGGASIWFGSSRDASGAVASVTDVPSLGKGSLHHSQNAENTHAGLDT